MAPPRKSNLPRNQSRAAGAPTRRSAAATAPMEGAHGTFYNPEEPTTREEPQPRAGFKTEFTDVVRHGSMPLERGGSVDREVAESMAKDTITDPNDLASEIDRIRRIRKPLGAYTQKLALPVRSGYHRHWFNDTAGRIEEAINNGWAHVKGKDDKPIARCVGTGRDKGAMYAYAMEIPEIFWLEDMAAKNKAATDKIDALKASPFQAKSGQVDRSDKGKFYDPTEAADGPLQVVKHN